jgi:curved DNA-binding protein CbpA
MPGILSRFTRGSKLSVAERHRLLIYAIEMFERHSTQVDVEIELRGKGASAEDARAIANEGRVKYEADLMDRVNLPPTVNSNINFYFLLGTTPAASADEIRKAYRRKAREVHPDQHNQEFSREGWGRLMAMVSDAHTVLTDPITRRAYDVIWRDRSRKLAVVNRRKGEKRGDWETRYRWSIAELATVENQIAEQLAEVEEAIRAGKATSAMGSELAGAVAEYEAGILDIRTQSYSLPTSYSAFGDEVRREMQRKERIVPQLRKLAYQLPDGAGQVNISQALAETRDALGKVVHHQHLFDIRSARG